MNGAIILDKPAGITSHDAVYAVRRITRERSVGHIGTLDPFATGVLVLLLGKATRLARYFGEATKTYEAVMRFGFATDTYDCTGRPLGPDQPVALRSDDLERLFRDFTGSFLQQPPAFSAKKVDGVRAYRLARRGQQTKLAPVKVAVSDWRLLDIQGKLIAVSVTVSSGTYIRSLANDLGGRLEVGAHLASLRRLRVGSFEIRDAVTLETLESRARAGGDLGAAFVPLDLLLTEMPCRVLSEHEYSFVVNGRDLAIDSEEPHLRLFSPEGKLAAIAERNEGGAYHPNVVLVAGEASHPSKKQSEEIANSFTA